MRYATWMRVFLVLVGGALAACVPAGMPAPVTGTIPAHTETPIVSTIPTLTPAATAPAATPTQPPPSAMLPAPVYFLAPSGTTQQIWRIENDGTAQTPITKEPSGVTDFDVSPADGSLAYVSGNVLIKADAQGHNRTVLVQGQPLAPERNESYYTTEVTRPRWSPDGARIAYGLNGINLIDAADGATIAVLPNDSIPGPSDPVTQTAKLYWPYSWSPDGGRMLIEIGYYRGEGSMGVLNLAENKVLSLSSPQGYVCCAPAWSPDSQSIYYANAVEGIVPPGLWRTDVITGQSETLIDGIAKDATLSVSSAFPSQDGQLYYFYAVTKAPRDPGSATPLSMYRAKNDGVTDQTQLRTDAYVIGEALWATDASGAVIVEARDAAGQYPPSGPLFYLKADGSPAVPLAEDGRLLRWGK